jgi:hypothetical protein
MLVIQKNYSLPAKQKDIIRDRAEQSSAYDSGTNKYVEPHPISVFILA